MSDRFGLFRVGSVFCYKPVGSGRVTEATIGFGSDSVSFHNGSGLVGGGNPTRCTTGPICTYLRTSKAGLRQSDATTSDATRPSGRPV